MREHDVFSKPWKAILLDVDGTLVDSNDAHAASWSETLRRNGYEVAPKDVRPLIGMGGDRLVARLTGLDPEDSRVEELGAERMRLFLDEYVGRLRAFPDVPELLEKLRRSGATLVVATSAKKKEAEAILGQAGLSWLLARATSSDDAERSKPAPDIVCAALEEAGVEAADALFLGDTPYDVEAGARAGVTTVAFLSGGFGRDELRGAAAVLEGAGDLLRKLPSASPSPRSREAHPT